MGTLPAKLDTSQRYWVLAAALSVARGYRPPCACDGCACLVRVQGKNGPNLRVGHRCRVLDGGTDARCAYAVRERLCGRLRVERLRMPCAHLDDAFASVLYVRVFGDLVVLENDGYRRTSGIYLVNLMSPVMGMCR